MDSKKRKADELENGDEKAEPKFVELKKEDEEKVTVDEPKQGGKKAEKDSNHEEPKKTDQVKDEKEDKNHYESLRYCIVKNDGKPDSCVKLIGLKQLFSKQLPKMPRPYIARLVFDRRHKSLAILSDDPSQKGGDEEIIGAICYRGFYEMRFAEIAFCAVNASHQVKVSELSQPRP